MSNEEMIRKIVREELKSLLDSMKETAGSLDGYETQQIEREALRAFKNLAGMEAGMLPHAWDCEGRGRYGLSEEECSCGIIEVDSK